MTGDNTTSLSGAGRLIVAWATENSGVAVYFEKQNKLHPWPVSLEKIAGHTGFNLDPPNHNPILGAECIIALNDTVIVNTAILGSLRSIRMMEEMWKKGMGDVHLDDYEGMKGIAGLRSDAPGSAGMDRTLDDNSVMALRFVPKPITPNASIKLIRLSDPEAKNGYTDKLVLTPGHYSFYAWHNMTESPRMEANSILRTDSMGLLDSRRSEVEALAFLSYGDKLLAGSWEYLTYFGRDTMMAALLLQPIVTPKFTEVAIGSVLERISSEGTVCHEEIIGEYAAIWNRRNGFGLYNPTAACDYSMVDTDFLLPIVLDQYLRTVRVKDGRAYLKQTAQYWDANRGEQFDASSDGLC